MNIRNSTNRFTRVRAWPLLAAAVAIPAVALTTTSLDAQNDRDGVRIAVYDDQLVFQRSSFGRELVEYYREIQPKMQQARQGQNQQEMQELQMEIQQKREQAVSDFQEEIESVLPEISEKMNLHAVAVDVVYTGDNVESVDITKTVVEELGGEMPAQNPQSGGFGQ